jgi:TonB family protein
MRRAVTGLMLVVPFFVAAIRIDAATHEETSKPDYRAVVVSAPRPEYPYEARRGRITGTGIVLIKVDASTGKVVSAEMAPSTGSVVLDAAALAAFRQWRFKPGTVATARLPITFTIGGNVVTEYRVKEKPMDDALAHFLGKGTVVKGPIPAYPRSLPWTNKQGKGVYELHVEASGRISEVKILKRSGDDVFDRVAVETLRTWRLRRGPLIIELPLTFKLTPASYSVDIPRDR